MSAPAMVLYETEPDLSKRIRLDTWRQIRRKSVKPTPEQEERDAREQGAIAAAVEGMIP